MSNNCESKNVKTKKSNDNVITFKNSSSGLLTENEINNLFLGFINLIKRNVVYEKERQYKAQINNFNKQIQVFLEELERKNEEILKLKQQICELSKETS